MRNKCTQITFIRNEISKITVANLSSQIARLNISENHLKKVPPEIFHLPKLTHLNLSRNQIKKLPKTFHESNLICINISENPIEKIPLEYPNTLAAFYCSYCNLKEIPSVLTTLTNLITFVSCGNKLKTIPKLPYIQKLLLSHNKLRKFPENLSDTLSVLDLSYNKIKEIPNVITLPSLQEVDLSFNEISILPNFNDCILLNTIKISNNPIITGTMKLDNFIHLDCIDISYTNITLLDVNESIREIVTSNPTLFKSPQYKLMQKNEYVSFAELKGHRDTMEDSLVVFSNIIPNFDLFCVFDGHGGSYTSTICSYEIIKYFQSCDLAEDEINEKFIEQFFECILLKLKEMNVKDGSTLALTLVSNDEIIISHLGDSRVLLIEENGEIRHATIDHKPDDKNEIKRILKEGGKVFKGRVSGTLSIARCLGDFYIPGIGRTPTTVKLELTHEDKWLILGCDGLFDLITNEEIAKIAMKADNPTELAYDLRNIAYHRYSPDNISVIAVDLQKKKTI